jgi:hypothetical protein
VGIEAIRAKLSSFASLIGSQFDFSEGGYLDAQESENASVFVLVSGKYYGSSTPAAGIAFVQSFLLCQQESATHQKVNYLI